MNVRSFVLGGNYCLPWVCILSKLAQNYFLDNFEWITHGMIRKGRIVFSQDGIQGRFFYPKTCPQGKKLPPCQNGPRLNKLFRPAIPEPLTSITQRCPRPRTMVSAPSHYKDASRTAPSPTCLGSIVRDLLFGATVGLGAFRTALRLT